jgi:diguanylate cyclase (GGDEF)-like protein
MKRNILLVSTVWLVLIAASFLWNYLNNSQRNQEIAFQTAKGFFKQVVVTRAWNAEHGGVYVPVSSQTRPNPFLVDPSRDIEISNDLTLTKINPAFMTRQISEIAAIRGGIQFHITSLKPIRPENRPTPREEKALADFEKGTPEIGEPIRGENGPSYFYMAPLKTERTCLKCHAKQGYREGGIRGGISVILPFYPETPIWTLGLGHGILGMVGVFGIFFFGTKLDRAYESLRNQAVIDSLTGIPNRRSFSERILVEYGRSRREKRALSLVMGDIDNFKSYNDTYGHKSGDECLKKVAAEIGGVLKRPGDFCARYGGEEFIVILPDTEQSGARELAEDIRSRIQTLEIAHKNSLPLRVVTMSLGVATMEGQAPCFYEDLINAADQALYRAKQGGRNRVAVWDAAES